VPGIGQLFHRQIHRAVYFQRLAADSAYLPAGYAGVLEVLFDLRRRIGAAAYHPELVLLVGHTALRQCHPQAAIGAIMSRNHQAGRYRSQKGRLKFALRLQVQFRHVALCLTVDLVKILRYSQFFFVLAE